MEKETEDLQIVIGTTEEDIWLEVKEARLLAIKSYEKALIVERGILEYAESKLTHLNQ